jgi:hypothetical protein
MNNLSERDTVTFYELKSGRGMEDKAIMVGETCNGRTCPTFWSRFDKYELKSRRGMEDKAIMVGVTCNGRTCSTFWSRFDKDPILRVQFGYVLSNNHMIPYFINYKTFILYEKNNISSHVSLLKITSQN